MGAMRRTLTLGVAWLAAAVVAAVVAWQGVGLIGDQVTDDRNGMLSAAEIDAALASGGGGIPVPPTTTTTLPPSSATTVAGATPPSTAPATAPEPAPVVKPYRVTGGTASISFSPSEVTVVLAQPDAGWSVKREPEGSGVRVEFESGNARSRIDAWWDGGPQVRIEDAGGSGGGSGRD